MRKRSLLLGLFVGTLCGIAAGGVTIATGDDDDGARYEARAEILGPPGSGIRGEARFRQDDSIEDQPAPVIEVDVVVRGLPREPRQRAFHVHDTGACDPPAYAAAGPHFDAGPGKNTTSENHPYHLGDVPQLEVRGGVGRLDSETTRFVLQPNHATTIFDSDGAAVVVHAEEDRGHETTPGGPGGPAGGARVACGVIEMSDAGDDD
jgi:superoxide dismutase, Cu-Zn family